MRAKEFILEFKDPPTDGSGPFVEPENISAHFNQLINHYIKQGAADAQAIEMAINALQKHHGDDASKWMQEADILPFKRPNTAGDMSDEDQYKMAVQSQQEPDIIHRPDVGNNPCKYCGDVYCDYDCNDSQNNLHKDAVNEYSSEESEEAQIKAWRDNTIEKISSGEMSGKRGHAVLTNIANTMGYTANPEKVATEWMRAVNEGNKENANALVGSGLADPAGKKTNSDSKAHKKVRTPGTGPNARTKYNNGAKPGANPGFVGG